MKTKKLKTKQFIFDTQDSDGATDHFLEATAPLIGYIVHGFNSLEQLLNSTICNLIHEGADTPGLIVLEKLNYSMKVDLFERYIKQVQIDIGKSLPNFKTLIKSLNEAGRLRNAVVHADWETTDLEGFTFVKHKMGLNGMEQEYTQFTPDSLDKIGEIIHYAYMTLDTHQDEYYNLFR